MNVGYGEIALLVGGAATTVLGTVVAWVLQRRLTKTQREWSVEDRRARHDHEVALRDRDIREARFQRLRSERREVYAKLLDCVEEFIAALRDLRDTTLPDVEVTSTHDLEGVHPVAARAVRSMERQRRLDSEVILIADHEVRNDALELSRRLRDAFKGAVQNRDVLAPVHEQYKVVLGAMRRELVGRTSEDSEGNPAALK